MIIINGYLTIIKTRIRDQYIQEFFTNINNNARLERYCIFKTEFV